MGCVGRNDNEHKTFSGGRVAAKRFRSPIRNTSFQLKREILQLYNKNKNHHENPTHNFRFKHQ